MSTASILLVLALIAFAALIVRHAFSRTMSSDQVVTAVLAVGLLIAGGVMNAANNRNAPSPAPEPQKSPESTPSFVKPTDMEMLAAFHRSSVEIFAGRPGFGGDRMIVFPPVEDEYVKPQGVATSSEAKGPKSPVFPGDLQNKKNSQTHLTLQKMVAAGRLNRPNAVLWGWNLKQFQLVGLVQHSEPCVYLTDKPLAGKNVAIPTRNLSEFETKSLAALQSGDHLKVEERDGTIRMLGPIFAGQRCVECHQRGQMLGAFTYVFERDPNYNPEVP